MNTYVKYNNFWWQYDTRTPKKNATLRNLVGGYNTGNNIIGCEIVEAESFKDLDWNGTEVLDNKYKFGWLDRKGNFYGCEYYCHSDQAELVHHSSRRKLEKLGWIHISGDLHKDSKLMATFCGDYENGVMPTDAQIKYLSEHQYIESMYVMYAYENGNRAKAQIYEQKLLQEQNNKCFEKQDDEKIL